jgi:dolichol-phosphate mannosyltransferase
MDNSPKLTIVMPTYKEGENLKGLIPLIKNVFKENNIKGGLLIVDDNSPDGTAELVSKMQNEISDGDFKLELLLRPGKLGLGTAYIDGYYKAFSDLADDDFILGMDADFSHDPKYIPAIYAALKDNQMVIGSRYVAGGGISNWSFIRRFVSRSASVACKIILGWDINDPTTAYVGFRVGALKSLPFDKIKTSGYGFLSELKYMAFKAGFRIKEIPIVFAYRVAGESKLSKKIFFQTIFNTFKLRSRKY